MRVAVFTASLPEWTPEEAVGELARLGYDGVEWRVVDQAPHDGPPGFWWGNRCTLPLSTFVEDAPRIRALTEAAGLAMPNVGTYTPCFDGDAIDTAMQGARLLGAPSMRVTLPGYDGSEPYLALRDRARRAFAEVARLAARHGVRALVELHHGTIVPSASSAVAFLDGLDPAHVGVIHDAGNTVFEGHEPYRMALEVLGPYLAHVHLKNARWRATDGRWHAEFAPLRDGIVDLRALFAALSAVGYDGWVSLEDFSQVVPLAERTEDNLRHVRECAARRPSG